jgi:CRP/FNR family transcriptional regulator
VCCSECSLNPVCLPLAVTEDELVDLESIMSRGRPLKRGEYLFRAADPFESIFAVRTGSVKAYTVSEDGIEQVTGFYLPGEIVGMDGISTAHHVSYAKTLESSSVCEIPFSQLEELSSRIPTLQHHFFKLMSKEIQADRELHMLLSKKAADDRVAALLLSIATRHKNRGLSDQQFRLPMSRFDMANYLGLAVETVSRIFTRFQQQGLIEAEGREIKILNRSGLCNLRPDSQAS